MLLLKDAFAVDTTLSEERIVFQTDFGDLELALYPKAGHGLPFVRSLAFIKPHFTVKLAPSTTA